jgi:hypothetical protein
VKIVKNGFVDIVDYSELQFCDFVNCMIVCFREIVHSMHFSKYIYFCEHCEFVTILNIVKSCICEFREFVIFVMLWIGKVDQNCEMFKCVHVSNFASL